MSEELTPERLLHLVDLCLAAGEDGSYFLCHEVEDAQSFSDVVRYAAGGRMAWPHWSPEEYVHRYPTLWRQAQKFYKEAQCQKS